MCDATGGNAVASDTPPSEGGGSISGLARRLGSFLLSFSLSLHVLIICILARGLDDSKAYEHLTTTLVLKISCS